MPTDMKKLFVILCCAWSIPLFAQTAPAQENAEVSFPSGESFKGSAISYRIINAANNTYCYDIYVDGKLTIHQPGIPGLPGNEGFKTKEQAAKVAELVIEKIKNGEMPPTVTEKELKQLGAI